MGVLKTFYGDELLVDDEDLVLFGNDEVFLGVALKYGMIKRDGEMLYVHRLITNAKKGEQVDHINMNTLDNRKSNLRVATMTQNRANQEKYNIKNPTSKFKGVCYDVVNKNWYSRVYSNNENSFNGRFKDEISAALAYNYHAKLIFGEFARLNDIDESDHLDWKDNQIKRNSNERPSIYKYMTWISKQNKWKALVQSKNYGNSKKKSFINEYEAVLYCNQYIIDNNLHTLEKSKKIQELTDEDALRLNNEQLATYKQQIKVKLKFNI